MEYLGRGSFSRVYLTQSNEVHKVLPLNPLTLREIKVLERLSELPDIEEYATKYYSLRREGNSITIVLSYLTGPDLTKIIDCSNLDYLGMLRHLIKGLNYFHENGVIHRDIKLDNIRLDKGVPKYIDFGFACMEDDFSCLSQATGTPFYLSPELVRVLRGTRSGDPLLWDKLKASDVWALGITFYIFLHHGEYPYKESSCGNPIEFLVKQILDPTPIISSTQYPEVDRLINLMLIKDYSRRPEARDLLGL